MANGYIGESPMTTDLDRWRQIAEKYYVHRPTCGDTVWHMTGVLKAIAEAVAEERERCARICDSYVLTSSSRWMSTTVEMIAAAIRTEK